MSSSNSNSNPHTFQALASAAQGFKGTVLSFDPGETTGWAVFHDHALIKAGQIPTGDLQQAWIEGEALIKRVVKFSEERARAANSAQPVEPPKNTGDQLPQRPVSLPHNTQLSAPHVVIEDYRVYAWKAEQHKYSSVYTVKVVTALELLAYLHGLPTQLCMAQLAKQFVTDDKLKGWGFWQTGERHARDAVRHGAYYIVRSIDKSQKRPAHNFDK